MSTVYLLLALVSLAAIGWIADWASRRNASALQLERSVAQLHILLRGLNEAVVTQGSLDSRNIVKGATAQFEQLRAELAAEEAALLGGWEAVNPMIAKLLGSQSNLSFDDDALIALGKISSGIEKMVAKSTARAEAERAQARRAEGIAGMVILGASALIFGGTLAIFFAFHNNVTRPVESAIAYADRVAQGDLTTGAQSERRGQAGRLLNTLVAMSDSLRAITKDVHSATHAIDGAAEQLTSGNEDLSRRTERQATALEETAASMEELSTAIGENAAGARLASQKAAEASAKALEGGNAVGAFLGKMESIQEGSRRMKEIISVIDGIAFQINILALNAAVEAARAGEHGRGFAVVASEVRALAQRTASAAKEIKDLIAQSAGEVAAGSQMVESSRRIMEDMQASIGEVTSLIRGISLASEEQATGVRQVSGAIVQMEQTVQENAALVERTAAGSRALKEQAKALSQAVSAFKVGGVAEGVQRASAAQRPAPRPARTTQPMPARAAAPALEARVDGEWKEF